MPSASFPMTIYISSKIISKSPAHSKAKSQWKTFFHCDIFFFFWKKKKNPTPLESFYILVTQTFICSHEKARLAYYIHNPQVLKLLQICHICRETCTLWRGVPGAHILDFVYETHGIRDDWNPRFLLFEKWKNSTSTTHSHPCHVEIFILFWWNHSVWH